MTTAARIFEFLIDAAPLKRRPGSPLPFRVCRFILIIAASLLALGPHFSLGGATLPDGFTETQVTGGLSGATAMAFAPDGRLFVCLQAGQLRVVKNDVLLPDPFLTVSTDFSGERGLLGIAFDPNFYTNNYVYVYYTTAASPKRNRISRFVANGDLAVANSETVILDLDNLSGATNHNGGAMHFGQDGKLYIAVGENANSSNAQTLSNLLGKILRLNPDGSIPADNPFYNTASGVNRAIWALGLRNPFTFAFQPGSGRMFINDVGQSTWEEINDGISGANYGWPQTEGPTTAPGVRAPLYAYGRSPSTTGGCAITGGTFYNPPTVQFPSSYLGGYFFADFCSGWIRLLNPSGNTVTDFAADIANPVDLQVAADGSLYYLARGAGALYKVQYPANQVPPSSTVPALLTEENTTRAIALDSVTGARDPFPLATVFNFSADQRTRVTLFALNVELLSGETSSVVTVQAEDARQRVYSLPVEFVGKVPGFNQLTQVIVKLTDDLPVNEDVSVSLGLRGVMSNHVLLKIK